MLNFIDVLRAFIRTNFSRGIQQGVRNKKSKILLRPSSAKRVFRSETRLTVYRPLYILRSATAFDSVAPMRGRLVGPFIEFQSSGMPA